MNTHTPMDRAEGEGRAAETGAGVDPETFARASALEQALAWKRAGAREREALGPLMRPQALRAAEAAAARRPEGRWEWLAKWALLWGTVALLGYGAWCLRDGLWAAK